MKNNLDGLFIVVCNMLRNPDNYGDLSIEAMCFSLEILNQRIINEDCSCVFEQEVSQKEYEMNLEKLFSESEFELIELITKIKNDIEHTEGDIKDDN